MSEDQPVTEPVVGDENARQIAQAVYAQIKPDIPSVDDIAQKVLDVLKEAAWPGRDSFPLPDLPSPSELETLATKAKNLVPDQLTDVAESISEAPHISLRDLLNVAIEWSESWDEIMNLIQGVQESLAGHGLTANADLMPLSPLKVVEDHAASGDDEDWGSRLKSLKEKAGDLSIPVLVPLADNWASFMSPPNEQIATLRGLMEDAGLLGVPADSENARASHVGATSLDLAETIELLEGVLWAFKLALIFAELIRDITPGKIGMEMDAGASAIGQGTAGLTSEVVDISQGHAPVIAGLKFLIATCEMVIGVYGTRLAVQGSNGGGGDDDSGGGGDDDSGGGGDDDSGGGGDDDSGGGGGDDGELQITVTSAEDTVWGPGLSTDVTATVKRDGEAVAGQGVTFSTSSGDIDSSATTKNDGEATVEYTAPEDIRRGGFTATITATASGKSDSTTIEVRDSVRARREDD